MFKFKLEQILPFFLSFSSFFLSLTFSLPHLGCLSGLLNVTVNGRKLPPAVPGQDSLSRSEKLALPSANYSLVNIKMKIFLEE